MNQKMLALFFFLCGGLHSESLNFTAVNIQDHLMLLSVSTPEDPDLLPEKRFKHSVGISSEQGPVTLGVDIANALSEFQYDGNNRPLVLEKARVEFYRGPLQITIGDSTVLLGRGIALDLYHDDVFGIHNTTQGVTARHDLGFGNVMVFAGRVNVLRAPIALNPVENTLADRAMLLGGATIDLRQDVGVKLAGHYFSAVNRPTGKDIDKVWHTVGASIDRENVFEGADLYFEPNAVISTRSSNGRMLSKPFALGTYGSLSYSEPDQRVKWEVKDYRNYDFEFRRPPTLEEDIVVSQNNEDVSAGRVQYETRVEGVWLTVSMLGGYDRVVGSQLYHGVVGTRMHLGEGGRNEVEAKAGYRVLREDGDMKHVQAKGKLITFSGQSVELLARKQLENKNLRTLATVEDRNVLEVTYNFSERWSLGIGYEIVPTNPLEQGSHFLNSNLSYKSGMLTARTLVGTTSGGMRCSGGVCRRVPPFSGAMLETLVSF